VGEFEPGPVAVDRANFIVDQIGFESGLADVVLVEINLIFAGAFGVDEPDVGRFRKSRRDHIQSRGQVAKRSNEAERQLRRRSEACREGDVGGSSPRVSSKPFGAAMRATCMSATIPSFFGSGVV
jgi:hypothetical protein